MPIKNHHRGETHQRNFRRASLKSQTGAALLTFVLIIIIGSSYVLVTKLNTNLALTQQSKETGIALSAAKNALIGYAITYPDLVNVDAGPGYLPCPDIDNDGDAEGSCALAGPKNFTTGRFPFETLELPELQDASGQRLWYALSENFRFGANKIIPLNSESPSSAELSVDGVSDIVAVVIAPGAPVDGQTRDINETVMVNEIVNYLEGDNHNLDASYISTLGDSGRKDGEYDANDNYTFNDRVVFITRQELMEAVEKRVLGEVKQFLTKYFNMYGAYPWLQPFADPKTVSKRLVGAHDGADDQLTSLTDASFIEDFDNGNNPLGDVSLTIPDAGSAGNIRLTNIDYYLLETAGEIPNWFLTNKWHQLIYVAYNGGDSPDGGVGCVPVSSDALTTNPCLVLTGGGSPNDNKRILIISAGEPLEEDLNQDRTTGDIRDYYELENKDAGDDNFETGSITTKFNDQMRVIDTLP